MESPPWFLSRFLRHSMRGGGGENEGGGGVRRVIAGRSSMSWVFRLGFLLKKTTICLNIYGTYRKKKHILSSISNNKHCLNMCLDEQLSAFPSIEAILECINV